MYLFLLVILTCHVAKVFSKTSESIKANKVNYVELGKLYTFEPSKSFRPLVGDDLHTFCYRANNKTIRRLFETVELHLHIEGYDYKQYDGFTPEEVQKHYDQHQSLFSFSLFSRRHVRLQLSPFVSTCLGVDSHNPYNLELTTLRIDFWRVVQLLLGCLIFKYANILSHNEIFYYITAIVLGICSSFMLIILLTSRLVPRRPVMYGVLIGGWTIGLWVMRLLWENMQVIIVTYKTYIFWYILITGSISFMISYRWGPPTNQRSKNIIKWSLQLVSLIIIYFSSHYEEATSVIIIVLIIAQYFPKSFWYKCRSYWLRKFPPKTRLLTIEEYHEQGVRETAKSLDGLRKYATSPDFEHRNVVTKLRDPFRFAAFAKGASHLRDEELLRFDPYEHRGNAFDDNDDESDIEENLRRNNTGHFISVDEDILSENDEYSCSGEDYSFSIVRAPMRNRTVSFGDEPSTSAASLAALRERQLTSNLRYQSILPATTLHSSFAANDDVQSADNDL